MKTRVTITLDPKVHRTAKSLARARATSVSGLIECLLSDAGSHRTDSLVDRMIGSAKLKDPEPGKDPIFDALLSKYADT